MFELTYKTTNIRSHNIIQGRDVDDISTVSSLSGVSGFTRSSKEGSSTTERDIYIYSDKETLKSNHKISSKRAEFSGSSIVVKEN